TNVYRNRISGLCTCGNVNVSTVVLGEVINVVAYSVSRWRLSLAWFRRLSIPCFRRLILTGLWRLSVAWLRSFRLAWFRCFRLAWLRRLSIPGLWRFRVVRIRQLGLIGKADRNHRFVHGLLCSASWGSKYRQLCTL